MIKYNPDASLLDYKKALSELQKEYKQAKIRYFASRIIIASVLFSILITLGIFVPALSDIPSKWLYVPIIITIVFIASSFKISVKSKDNSFSDFINCDYKGLFRYIRHDIRTVSYYISCIENGEIPDPTYCYISCE